MKWLALLWLSGSFTFLLGYVSGALLSRAREPSEPEADDVATGAPPTPRRLRPGSEARAPRRVVASALFGLVLFGAATVEAATPLPWSTVADLEANVARGFVVAGCEDARRIEIYLVVAGGDAYYLFADAEMRWAIMGPTDARGQIPIWYGTVASEDRLAIEGGIEGTAETDICPLLTRRNT